MRQGGLLQILYKKNLPLRFAETTHELSDVPISQETRNVATLAMGLMTAIMVLMYERRLKQMRDSSWSGSVRPRQTIVYN